MKPVFARLYVKKKTPSLAQFSLNSYKIGLFSKVIVIIIDLGTYLDKIGRLTGKWTKNNRN